MISLLSGRPSLHRKTSGCFRSLHEKQGLASLDDLLVTPSDASIFRLIDKLLVFKRDPEQEERLEDLRLDTNDQEQIVIRIAFEHWDLVEHVFLLNQTESPTYVLLKSSVSSPNGCSTRPVEIEFSGMPFLSEEEVYSYTTEHPDVYPEALQGFDLRNIPHGLGCSLVDKFVVSLSASRKADGSYTFNCPICLAAPMKY